MEYFGAGHRQHCSLMMIPYVVLVPVLVPVICMGA